MSFFELYKRRQLDMKILSFDPAIRNYAYCILDSSMNIIEWDVIEIDRKRIPPKSMNDCELLCTELIKEFDKRPQLLEVDYILIEKQMKANMKILTACTFTYFYNKNIECKIYSPSHKLNCCPEISTATKLKGKKKYNFNKKKAIEHCVCLLSGDEKWTEFFNNKRSKKDDLADCYLQGISYIKFQNKIYAKEPSASQIKAKKFNKYNLKWMLDILEWDNTREQLKLFEDHHPLIKKAVSMVDISELL